MTLLTAILILAAIGLVSAAAVYTDQRHSRRTRERAARILAAYEAEHAMYERVLRSDEYTTFAVDREPWLAQLAAYEDGAP